MRYTPLVRHGLIVLLIVLAASPLTAPFAVQDVAALAGGTSVQAKKAGDDLQAAPADAPAFHVALIGSAGDMPSVRPGGPAIRPLCPPLRL